MSGLTEHSPIFQARGLSGNQEHSLVITSVNTNRWSLDCIVYNTQNSAVAGGGAGGGSVIGSGGGGGVTGASGGGGGPSVGAIIGSVIAGIVAGMAIAAIIFLLLRRRKLKSKEEPKMENVAVTTGSHFDSSLQPSPFTPPVIGQNGHATPSPNKRYDLNNGSSSALASGAGERVGRVPHDSDGSTSYLGTQSALSSPSPGISPHSGSESQHIISPVQAGPSHGYG
jgi:hypothetical protein